MQKILDLSKSSIVSSLVFACRHSRCGIVIENSVEDFFHPWSQTSTRLQKKTKKHICLPSFYADLVCSLLYLIWDIHLTLSDVSYDIFDTQPHDPFPSYFLTGVAIIHSCRPFNSIGIPIGSLWPPFWGRIWVMNVYNKIALITAPAQKPIEVRGSAIMVRGRCRPTSAYDFHRGRRRLELRSDWYLGYCTGFITLVGI